MFEAHAQRLAADDGIDMVGTEPTSSCLTDVQDFHLVPEEQLADDDLIDEGGYDGPGLGVEADVEDSQVGGPDDNRWAYEDAMDDMPDDQQVAWDASELAFEEDLGGYEADGEEEVTLEGQVAIDHWEEGSLKRSLQE